MIEISEKNLEDTIEALLHAGGPDSPIQGEKSIRESSTFPGIYLPGGFRKRFPEDYDRSLCLIPKEVIDFVYITQPKEWEKLKKSYSGDPKAHFLERLSQEISHHGTLHVLRKGIKDLGCKFRLAYFQPASGINKEIQRLYQGNTFSVIRQVKYSLKNEKSLDLVIFLNGLPIFTAELKNPLTGQTVQNAISQYRNDRDPHEPLFAFGRCMAHFGIDPDLVYFTTHLEGQKTRFVPFNRGKDRGAGNPPAWKGFSTAYLWEQIWSRDSLLNLLQYFIHEYEEEDDQGKKTGERKLIFPRFHQLDAVRRLISDAHKHGPGKCYLIEHSAGSGKSNSIAWLAHQLSVLHNDKDQKIFDSVVVITDRRVLDRQLQRTIRQFEQTLGTVENIDKTSRQLKQALEDGKSIIVTTLQKFPVISSQMQDLPGSRFAVIIDEAHSSQSGESTKHLNAVLATDDLEQAEKEDNKPVEDLDDKIVADIKKRGHLPNVSYFAFTATPKAKTLELFGTKQEDGTFLPFSLYSMRQAIEEGFILDVLQNYTTYHAFWNLLKKIKDDPKFDRQKAAKLMLSFVDMHEHTIGKKVEIIVEHFTSQVQHRINGHAKAMIVTRSRLHAVRYKHIVDAYLKDHGIPYKALVAFSGTVKDGGIDYTETLMNGFPESQTAETFKKDEYRLLIVAEKFQTGFDQPLLHTMYVDKRLRGLHAVQTLSRLDRIYPPYKEDTFVLDFANDAEDIRKAFEPYYEETFLSEGTDPNLLYDLQTQVEGFHLLTQPEIERFAEVYFSTKGTQAKLYSILQPAVDRYKAASDEDKVKFRAALGDFIRLYAFLSQILSYQDADLEKFYVYARLLIRRLPVEREKLPLEIQQAIDLDSYRMAKTKSGKISLKRREGELEPENPFSNVSIPPSDVEALSQIIRELNQRFGTDFSEQDHVVIKQIEDQLAQSQVLADTMRVNAQAPENAKLTFVNVLNDLLQDLIDTQFKFYKQVNDNPDFAKTLTDFLFRRYRISMGLPAG